MSLSENKFIRYSFLLIATLALSAFLWGQAETGQITGAVLDPAGATVPNASVTVTNAENGAERRTTSGGAGDYAVTNLLPGQYTVTVDAPGFAKFRENVVLTVGARVGLDAKLQIGSAATTVEVAESAVQVNTESQTLSQNVSEKQLRELPTLTRDPYALVALAGNVSDAGAGNRGVGYAINGMREASTNVMLDGAANNNEFNAGVGQAVPLDSVQEFSVLTNNFTAEFGRASGGVVNLVTKSGTNQFHGTAYEFNRVSKLSSNSFQNNAFSLPKSVFDRNQFGYSLGGPVKKDKLFFFSSTEWTRIRSTAENIAFVPTPQFLGLTAPNTQQFFSTYGALKPGTAVLGAYSINRFAANGVNLCGSNAACNALDPNLPIFNQIGYTTNGDAGGGPPQNQYTTVERVDWNISDRTQVYARYALQSILYSPGYVSYSPYQGFDSGETDFNNNALVSVTHSFTPSFVSQSKAVFNRLNQVQGFGPQPAVPTLYTGASGALQLLSSTIVFPGYSPTTPGAGIPFGGPQNFVQLYEDLSWTKGKHNFRFGGSFDYERDNRTFGAYETAGEYLGRSTGSGGSTVGGLLSGTLYQFQTAIYPQGKFPGQTVNYPLSQPNFSRSNRYNEGAVYVQDSWKLKPTFTLNLGLRWEHFGVQHNKYASLDSNCYDPSSQVDTPLGIRQGTVYLAPQSPVGQLWKPDWHDFAPRIGYAWDIFGDGKTSLRGGYGIGYERNFGNVTFNVIQNPPNYETVSLIGQNTPISASNLGPFSAATGTLTLPKASLRNVDPNIRTSYAHLWSTSLEHEFGKGVVVGADYTGSRGVHLYDIQVINRPGYGNVYLGDPCSAAAGDCLSYLNNQYSGINRRGDKGYSFYNGLNLRTSINNVHNTGLTMTANYTWSHAIDTLSSTFSDTDNFSNNNGQFIVGYLNPYDPMLDKGSSDFDIRQRVSLSMIYTVPFFKSRKGLLSQILGGWEVAPLFTARTGSPYSIFDGSQTAYYDVRAGITTPLPTSANKNAQPNGSPDSYNFLNIPNSSVDHFTSPTFGYADLGPYPGDMTGRNILRAPGFWELDAGVYKNFKVSERFGLQLRGEAYNLFNHANLYVNGAGAELAGVDPTASGTTSITACKGCTGLTPDRRNLQLALKLTF